MGRYSLLKTCLAIAWATLGIQLAHAQPSSDLVPRSPPAQLEPMLFNTVKIAADWPAGPQTGHGLIVAMRGNDLLVATARHVVWDKLDGPAAEVSVSLLADDRGNVEQRKGHIEPGWMTGIPERADLAFVSVPMNRAQTLWRPSMSQAAASAGDLVWILGDVDGTRWSPSPGQVGELATEPFSLVFSGGGAASGISGSPLVSYGGVVGLVRESSGSTAYAIPVAYVKATFDRLNTGSWRWVAEPAPLVERFGWVRLRRTDGLGPRFAFTVALTADRRQVMLGANQWTKVPVGRYEVRATTLGGIQSGVACDLSSVSVKPYVEYELPLTCYADPTGLWDLFDGRFIKIDRAVSAVFPVKVINANGREIGNGTARLHDEVMLSLNLQDEQDGVTAAELTLGSMSAKGTMTLVERGGEREIQIFRRR